jgi:16S rRNA A1518/A1519 N6-dimethyltransferase RsmA/KsgA/DIM1 with predicted DNA glycosylase/AP lyase activity
MPGSLLGSRVYPGSKEVAARIVASPASAYGYLSVEMQLTIRIHSKSAQGLFHPPPM